MALPQTSKAVILQRSATQKKPAYDDAVLVERPVPQLKPGELLVKVGAVAFNHRDVSTSLLTNLRVLFFVLSGVD